MFNNNFLTITILFTVLNKKLLRDSFQNTFVFSVSDKWILQRS